MKYIISAGVIFLFTMLLMGFFPLLTYVFIIILILATVSFLILVK